VYDKPSDPLHALSLSPHAARVIDGWEPVVSSGSPRLWTECSGRRLVVYSPTTADRGYWQSRDLSVTPGGTYTVYLRYLCKDASLPGPTPQVATVTGENLLDWTLVSQTLLTEWQANITFAKNIGAVRLRLYNYGRAGQTVALEGMMLYPAPPAPVRWPVGRPYELGDRPPDVQRFLRFAALDGGPIGAHAGVTATLLRSNEQPIWGRHVARLTYGLSGLPAGVASSSGDYVASAPSRKVELLPPRPIQIPERADALQLWVQADNYYSPYQPQVRLRLRDGAGASRLVELGALSWMYWFEMHGLLPADMKLPATLEAIELQGITNAAPMTVYLDSLAASPTGRRAPIPPVDLPDPLPFPTRPETILPTPRGPVAVAVTQEGDAFVFRCKAGEVDTLYRYTPRTGHFGDIEARLDGDGHAWFQPLDEGGPEVELGDRLYGPGDPRVKRELVAIARAGDRVRARFRFSVGDDAAEVVYALEAKGRSLLVEAEGEDRKVASLTTGIARRIGVPTMVAVPFLTFGDDTKIPRVLAADGLFASALLDWYVSRGSTPYGAVAGSLAMNGGVLYTPRTDGRRSALNERLFLTVAPHFDECLPNIPNPPSPMGAITGPRLLATRMHYGGDASDYENELEHWRRLRALGVEHLIVRLHADVWRTVEAFTLKLEATPYKGGDKPVIAYLEGLTELGYRVGLYTNYMLISPLRPAWSPDLVSLAATGARRSQPYATYVVKPSQAPALEARFAPEVHRRFGTSASYCDQHTHVTPWSVTDFDDRDPEAGQFAATFRAYGWLLMQERVHHDGPCFSEGGVHWMYAGLVDGSYGQTGNPGQPTLVDFALRKIHPQGTDVGCDLSWLNADLDRNLATTVAYGGIGMLWGGVWSRDWDRVTVPEVLRSYFMLQQLQSRYAMIPVVEIRYGAGDALVDTDEAIRGGAYKDCFVYARYENGTEVYVNRNASKEWTVTLKGQRLVLPPAGYAAAQGDDFFEFSALVDDGHRADYVRSPEYIYADGRGTLTRFPEIATAGAVLWRPDRAWISLPGGEPLEPDPFAPLSSRA
jgi:hypothetical protein